MGKRPDLEILEEELATLVTFREYLQRKIDRLRHEIRYVKEERFSNKLDVDRSLFIPTNCITPHVIKQLKIESQTAFANRAGVSTRTITNIADAETEFTSDTIAEAVFLAMDLPHIYAQLTPVRLKKSAKMVDVPEPPPSQYFEE